MNLNKRVDTKMASVLLTVGTLAAMGGCSQQRAPNLPPGQAEAIEALEALGAKVTIRDDEVKLIDFYSSREIAAAVLYLKPFVNLKKINFSSTPITDDELAHLVHLENLEELALNATQVTDAGLKNLAGFRKLQLLNLDNDKITDAGLVYLKGLTALKRLHLNKTAVSDAGLVSLTGLKNLEWLLVYDTQVTPAGADRLRQSLPDLEIVVSKTANEPEAEAEAADR